VKKKYLSVLALVMINLAALGGIRTWAPMAESGFASVFFLIFSVLGFFIPVSLITAELATTWPQAGGVYNWIKEAFGHRLGYLSIWLLWIQNVLWFPTMLTFLASSITFIFDPTLAQNKFYTFAIALILFWTATLINLRGMKASSWLSSIGAICGTFIPSILLIALGAWWYFQGKPIEIEFSVPSLVPDLSSFQQLSLLAGIIVSLLGIEMSAVHAGDVEKPQRNFPKAILFSSIFLVLFSVLGVLSIAMVVPKAQILLSAGCLQAFAFFFNAHGFANLVPWIAVIITLGGLGSLATWIIGPAKGLIAAAREEDLPAQLRETNSNDVPKNFLWVQAIVVSALSFAFLFMPSVNSAYWFFMVLLTQLYLIMYLLLFGAAVKLRYTHSHIPRPFSVPGGIKGMWIFGIIGFLSSVFALGVCFFPPSQIPEGQASTYILSLVGGIALLVGLPFAIAKFRTRKTPALN
jgi:glutamate:GABA antiporter